jgi:ABC-type bacteriocin/lantibiotic exporter with double-glycine peptidase domain
MENKTQIQKLRQFNQERKVWLVLSILVISVTLGIIFDWTQIYQNQLSWLVVSLGLLMAVTWWFWTMRLIKEIIDIKINDREILQDLIEDVQYIRTEILKTLPKRD